MNTTPIEKCYLSKDARYDVQVATAKGWTNFAVFPNGRLVGTSPSGVENEIVPQYAEMLKENAPELLAALEAARDWIEARLPDSTPMMRGDGQQKLDKIRAAIAKAKGEANA